MWKLTLPGLWASFEVCPGCLGGFLCLTRGLLEPGGLTNRPLGSAIFEEVGPTVSRALRRQSGTGANDSGTPPLGRPCLRGCYVNDRVYACDRKGPKQIHKRYHIMTICALPGYFANPIGNDVDMLHLRN